MSKDIVITNLDIIEPYYDFVSCISFVNDEQEIKEENVKIWKPLEFWFNRDTRLALPACFIPFNETKIIISLTAVEELFNSREP
ncbi:NCLDV major capsid protein [Klosneuvirus KNV1]|uniref:NCLDV major capsid protein n=1 Tax=Klosneuvirus KNV1 TaxID=1977640 RepID=A0A1V0SHM3_9VIRU|nr:NCLDV major capsid protein [Klosneuvirus KNV1]